MNEKMRFPEFGAMKCYDYRKNHGFGVASFSQAP